MTQKLEALHLEALCEEVSHLVLSFRENLVFTPLLYLCVCVFPGPAPESPEAL